MDLSIIDRALRLRDEARKAQLGDNAPDLTPLNRGENGRMEQPTGLPDDKIAVELMDRALELFAAVRKETDPDSTPEPDPQSQVDVAELLAAATAELPMFDEADLAGVDTPPILTRPPVEEPPVVQPPISRPPRVPPVVAQPPVARPPVSPPPIGDATGGTVRAPRATPPGRSPTKRTSKKKGGSRRKKPKSDDDR
jgi:hypothetical protein